MADATIVNRQDVISLLMVTNAGDGVASGAILTDPLSVGLALSAGAGLVRFARRRNTLFT